MDELKTVVFGSDGRMLNVTINKKERTVMISESLDGEDDENALSITTTSFSELASIFLLVYEQRNLDIPLSYIPA